MDGPQETRDDNCCYGQGSGRPIEWQYPGLEDAARLFKALADETRLAILKQLQEQGELCACHFLACCTRAQPTVSHHLKVLREAGLVNAEKRGLWIYYSLNNERLKDALTWLA